MSQNYCYKVRLGVVLFQDNRLLLVRQNDRPFWVFPGGTLEVEEGLEECAIREMKEEIDLDVCIEKTLYLADFLLATEQGTRHTIDVFMLARHLSGTPNMTLDENLNEMGFFTLEEVRAMQIEPKVVADRLLKDWPDCFQNANGLYLGKYGNGAGVKPNP
ncbi:NUDIX hydrolase [Vampirovibrio sp.]|uniref:NUDIX hydrolase n=1 Tax=Vampirovibrio sp. TaxID=2717857 RepID=UPI00359439E0